MDEDNHRYLSDSGGYCLSLGNMADMSPVKWRRDARKFPGPNTTNGKTWGLALKQSKMIVLHEWLIIWNI